ncbi:MAG: hypothetical protein KTV77_05410 [Wolbachia endosymbiont of Fragariocoptes setiger]|nr:hypothetical protein [Wolbachia endosymbiont of Fragariocoptes setiger]
MENKLKYILSKFCNIINNHKLSELKPFTILNKIDLDLKSEGVSSFKIKSSYLDKNLDHTEISLQCSSSSRRIEYIIDNNNNMTYLEKTSKEIFDLLIGTCKQYHCSFEGIPYSYKKEAQKYCDDISTTETTEDYCDTYLQKPIFYIPLMVVGIMVGGFLVKKVYTSCIKHKTEPLPYSNNRSHTAIAESEEFNNEQIPSMSGKFDSISSIVSYTAAMNRAVEV